MARMLNSFALLGDEEGDDMTVLVENFAKKVDVVVVDSAAVAVPAKEKNLAAANQSKSQQGNAKAPKFQASEFGVRTEGGRGRGGRGRGAGRGGYGRNDGENYGNEQENGGYRRNWDEAKGNGYDDGYRGRGRGRAGGGGRGRGRGRFNNEPLIRDEKDGSGDNTNVEDAADGWEQVPQTHSRGYVNYANNRDEERPFRDGNRNYGGERRGYGGGNREFRPRRDGGNYGKVEQENNEDVKEEKKETVDGVDANDVIVEPDTAIAEGDAAAVTEEPKEAGAEEKTQEEGVKAENPPINPVKKEEDEDENLMTLEEYEKLVAEKRKALEAQKIEVRTVTADKDFEAMQLLQKKKEEILLVKPEAAKLKKKESLEKDEKTRKTLSINEFLKPADGEEFVYRRPGRGRGGRGGRGGDFKTGERGGRGGEFRTGERGGRGGEFRTGEHGGRGGEFRTGERGGRSSGDFRNGDRGFGNNYPRGGGRARDGPIIPIADQSQFPVLKGSAPAVEAA